MCNFTEPSTGKQQVQTVINIHGGTHIHGESHFHGGAHTHLHGARKTHFYGGKHAHGLGYHGYLEQHQGTAAMLGGSYAVGAIQQCGKH